MAFEWDEDKREAHLVKHGVDFRHVTPTVRRPTVETVDDRYNYSETRINAWAKPVAESTSSPIPGEAQTAESSARGKPMRENKERITRVSSDEARRLKGETDYARLDSMTDDDIAKAVADDPTPRPSTSTGIRPASSSARQGHHHAAARPRRPRMAPRPGQGLPDPHQPGPARLLRRPDRAGARDCREGGGQKTK